VTEHPGGAPATAAAGPGTVATLSSSALRENLSLALARPRAGADPLAADAWGHGAAWVRAVLGEQEPGAGAPRAADALHEVDAATLYGLPGGVDGARPVMRVSGLVLSTKELRAGEGVSYGYLHIAPADTRVALVTGGYAQGIVRALGSRVSVVIAGGRYPIVGRVAMDVCVVDIGAAVVDHGAEVVFFGDPRAGEPSLAEWTTASGLGAADLVATAGLRAHRVAA
jgi:alanine racemase